MGFDSFLGNPSAVASVRAMLAGGRVRGSLLFTGPEGVGKKTLALMVAKALVCENGPSDFCGACPACRRAEEMLNAGREDLALRRGMKDAARRGEGLIYFDLQLIEPLTRYILTEQVRQMRSVAYTHPFEFAHRVFILDEAQSVHWQAVDLLLKVLEEPPDTSIFILVTSNAYELRPTIRSRCVRVPFQPVEQTLLLAVLAKDKHLTKAQQALAARVAAGSVAKAKTFDWGEYEKQRKPWLGFLEAVTRQASTPDWRLLFDSTRALAENRDDLEATLTIGYSLLRDLLYVRTGGSQEEVVNLDLLPNLQGWAARLGLPGIEQMKVGLDQAYRLQVRNVNQQLGLETLGIDLATGTEAGT